MKTLSKEFREFRTQLYVFGLLSFALQYLPVEFLPIPGSPGVVAVQDDSIGPGGELFDDKNIVSVGVSIAQRKVAGACALVALFSLLGTVCAFARDVFQHREYLSRSDPGNDEEEDSVNNDEGNRINEQAQLGDSARLLSNEARFYTTGFEVSEKILFGVGSIMPIIFGVVIVVISFQNILFMLKSVI